MRLAQRENSGLNARVKVLVTGAAGFIGYHTSKRLLAEGVEVVGVDNLNAYYNPQLKAARLEQLKSIPNFSFQKIDFADGAAMAALFKQEKFTHVAHLGAQAGVRYSLTDPHAYIQSNLVGFSHILEGCRQYPVQHLVFASSSSVYGLSTAAPFEETQVTDHPASLYAATKKANEAMAHSYSHLFAIPSTGLRFFTVYGPWGRPDMAYFSFTRAILRGEPIELFNHGKMRRDFTYIDDVVEGVVRTLHNPPQANPAWQSNPPVAGESSAPYRLFNIGNSNPVELLEFVSTLENLLDKKAATSFKPLQPGDVLATHASTQKLEEAVGYRPTTSLEIGLERFVKWYLQHRSLCEA